MNEDNETTVCQLKTHRPSLAFSLISLLFFAFYALPSFLLFCLNPNRVIPSFFSGENSLFWWIALASVLSLLLATLLYTFLDKKGTRSVLRFLSVGFLVFALALFIAFCCHLPKYDKSEDYLYYGHLALLCLLLALNCFYYSFSFRLYRAAKGEPTIQLTSWEQRRFVWPKEGSKKTSQIFFEGVNWLFFVAMAIVCLALYPELTSREGGVFVWIYVLLAHLSVYPLVGFGIYLFGGWSYNLWVMKAGRSKESRRMLIPLIGALAIGIIGIPIAYHEGIKHVEWASTYTREKWEVADQDDRSRMIGDFEKQVNLVGKNEEEVVYYLGEPSRKTEENGQIGWDYSLGITSGLHHDFETYYQVSFVDGYVQGTSYLSEKK
jgi:hypothetical protein